MLSGSAGRAEPVIRLRALGWGAAFVVIFLAFLPGAVRVADAVEAADLAGMAEPAGTPAAALAPAGNMAWAEAHGQVRRIVEELRSEIEAMKRIAAAQKELMAWNGERARLGLAAMTLRPELCREAEIGKWCRLLPATFGVAEEDRR
ncbi:MAG: hypothetical protein OXN81_13010 [Alphaproteobacteria bacterium]|nr:hypothetical protein [Alphaproteobacteria bacterium]